MRRTTPETADPVQNCPPDQRGNISPSLECAPVSYTRWISCKCPSRIHCFLSRNRDSASRLLEGDESHRVEVLMENTDIFEYLNGLLSWKKSQAILFNIDKDTDEDVLLQEQTPGQKLVPG
ncbi:hypothetical protein AVEN_164557-1 [Araneus ventricosus]|uniref:Uncharacterized protein n=1 Tax=Araneus ventricosus TaxID=182803 RepID=A0A4Y2B3J3_ARAVE|nr:hypothetical protein AVEN_164557-1 [Araneus ventricosus]